MALKQHLHRNKERNQISNFVYNEEPNNIIRVGDELLQKYDLMNFSKTKKNRKSSAKGLQKQTQTSIIRNLNLKLCMAASIEPSKKTRK